MKRDIMIKENLQNSIKSKNNKKVSHQKLMSESKVSGKSWSATGIWKMQTTWKSRKITSKNKVPWKLRKWNIKYIFSLQNCIIKWKKLIRNCISVKHISIFIKMIFHVKQFATKKALDPIPDEIKDLKKDRSPYF